MSGPLGAVRFVHAPIRNDLKGMKQELSVIASLGVGDIGQVAKRFGFWEGFLRIHEHAEEVHLFPAVDAKVPGTSRAYEQAHRQMDALRDQLRAALASSNTERSYEAVSEMVEKINAHLTMEENELVPFCDEHIPFDEQASISGKMSAEVPRDQMPAILGWMFKLQDQSEREGYLRVLGSVMPPQAFQGVRGIAKDAISAKDWIDLTQRMPELAS